MSELFHQFVFPLSKTDRVARMLGQYVDYFNVARPHQGMAQRLPLTVWLPVRDVPRSGWIAAMPVLNGLYHDYRRVVDRPTDVAVIAGRKV